MLSFLHKIPSISYFTSSEGISNFCDDGLISSGAGRRCEHKHKVKDEGIAGIFLVIYAPRRSDNAIARNIPEKDILMSFPVFLRNKRIWSQILCE